MGHWIVDCMRMGTKIISVDPRHIWMTTRSAHHLQIRAGTDGALALGMLGVIIENNLYDRAFVDNWTDGFGRLTERVREYPMVKDFRGWAHPDTAKRVQVGECRSDWEINFEMARRLNPDTAKRWPTLEDLFNERLAVSGFAFKGLSERGGWAMPDEGPFKPYRRHERGLLRPDGRPGFSTESGKVELYCKKYEKRWKNKRNQHCSSRDNPGRRTLSKNDFGKTSEEVVFFNTRHPLLN